MSNQKVETTNPEWQWVDARVPLTRDEVTRYFGVPCEEYEPTCVVCSSWVEWMETGKVTISFTKKEIIKLLEA